MIVCDALDPFFDGELPGAAAARFRVHLASCLTCQDELRGRMLEESSRSAAETSRLGIASRVVALRPRPYRIVAPALVMAAAAMLVVWFVRPSSPPDARVAITFEHKATKTLAPDDEARLGDTLHLRFAPANVAVWVYVDAQRLVLACPGQASCHGHGVDLVLVVPGTYSIVSTTTGDDNATPSVESIRVR